MVKKEDTNYYGKTKIPITSEIFQLVRDLLLSDNRNIQLKDVIEIKRFFSIIDFEKYTNFVEDIPASDYLAFLNDLVDASLENNSISRLIVIQNLLNESKDKEKFKVIYDNRKEISNEDINHLKKFMSDHVTASYIFNGSDELTDLVTKIKSGNYESVTDVVEEYKRFITKTYRDITAIKIKENDERLNSGLSNDSLLNLVSETIKEISTPGFYINTGFKNLDFAMGGGLKRGALTLFGARTAGFKSGLMLNLACSIKMFSKSMETFDKTKKPAIIYLSLENTQTESCKRLITYATGKTPADLVDAKPLDIVKQLQNSLNCATSNPDVELKLMYKKSNSITVNDIYNIITDVESEGYEVVSLFVDYLATMRSPNFASKDMQSVGLAMADNARELYDLAISKNIAVVSAYQLNREAYDKSKKLTGIETRKLVAESLKMLSYADYVFTITKDFLPLANGKVIDYLRFDETKQRSNRTSNEGFFYEVFEADNNFRLLHSKVYRKPDGTEFNFKAFSESVAKYIEQHNEEDKKRTQINRAQSISSNSYSANSNDVQQKDFNDFLKMNFNDMN